MAEKGQTHRSLIGADLDGDVDREDTVAVVLDAIAEYCLNALRLSGENDLAAISASLEKVLLEVGKRLSLIERDKFVENGFDDPSSAAQIDD